MEALLTALRAGAAALAGWETTSFGMLFLPLAAAVLLARPRWLLALLPVAAVMQAPAVGTLALGDARQGVTPFNAVCLLAALHLAWRVASLASGRAPREPLPPALRRAWWLWSAFFALAALGALLLPRWFEGIPVHPAMVRGASMPWTEPLQASVSNLAQFVNVMALWLLFAWALLLPARGRLLRTFGAGLALALALAVLGGLHQRGATAGWWPWMLDFWASNPSYNQWFHAPEYGPKAVLRSALPFIEPSYASVWFAAACCGALAWALYGTVQRRTALLLAVLAGVGLASTLGSSGMFALLAFVAFLLAWHVLQGRRLVEAGTRRAVLAGVAAAGTLAAVLGAAWLLRTDALAALHEPLAWTWDKLASYGGSGRDVMNRQVGEVLQSTWGLGAGAGSTRASGYFHSLLANTGLAGLALFLAAFFAAFRAAMHAARRDRPLTLALPAAAFAILLGVAVGIADQSWPVLWVAWLGLLLAALDAGAAAPARPLRVMLLTQWFDPEPTIKGLAFARELAARGHVVDVVTGFPNYPGGKIYPGFRLRPLQREHHDGVRVLRVPLYPSHDGSGGGRAANYLSFAACATLAGVVLARRPDVVYAYHPPLTTAMAGAAVAWLRDVPLVMDVQDLWPDTLRATGMIRSARVLALVGRVCRAVYAGATRIAVLSPGFRHALLERGVPARKVEVIYNWADEASLGLPGEAPAAMQGRFNVVFAGTMGKAQALDAVLDAARAVAPRAPAVQFVFVGGGIEVERLRARAADERLANVVFLPRMPMNEIGRVLHAADALLVHLKDDPLFAITVPSKTQAYMAVGRPVIMAVRGDAARLVQDAGAGLVAEPGSPASLAAAVLALAAMAPSARDALGAAGAAHYRAELSLASGARRFEALFLRAIHDHHALPAPVEENRHVANHC